MVIEIISEVPFFYCLVFQVTSFFQAFLTKHCRSIHSSSRKCLPHVSPIAFLLVGSSSWYFVRCEDHDAIFSFPISFTLFPCKPHIFHWICAILKFLCVGRCCLYEYEQHMDIWCMFVRPWFYTRKEENQLDATEWFVVLIICYTCFGHLYCPSSGARDCTCVITAYGV